MERLPWGRGGARFQKFRVVQHGFRDLCREYSPFDRFWALQFGLVPSCDLWVKGRNPEIGSSDHLLSLIQLETRCGIVCA